MSYMDIIDGVTDAIANVGEVGVSVLDNLFEVASGVLGPVFVAGANILEALGFDLGTPDATTYKSCR